MALYFLETSALVKLYVWEPGTDRLLPLVNAGPENRFAVVTISAVEARSALRRRQRAGDIDQNTADTLLDALQKHLETLFVQQPINDAVLGRATEMIDRYPLRAYDAIQLAGCLVLRSIGPQLLTFACSDQRLLEAAQSEGITTFDPAA